MKLTIQQLRDAQDALVPLWDSGVLSTNTYLDAVTQIGKAIEAEIEAVRAELMRSAV